MGTGHHESTEQISPQSETWLRIPWRPPHQVVCALLPCHLLSAACGSRSLLRGLIFGGPEALDSRPPPGLCSRFPPFRRGCREAALGRSGLPAPGDQKPFRN